LYFSPSIIRIIVEEDEVGGACGTNGREEERVYVIGRKVRGREATRKAEM
jgi:hypothetical protein